MLSRSSPWWWAALALLPAACGDDDPHGSAVTLAELPAIYKSAFCRHATACGLFPDLGTCIASDTGPRPAIHPTLVVAVAAGRVIYDGEAAGRCYDAMATATCDRTDREGRVPVRDCFAILRGTTAAGAACVLDEQCVSQQCEIPPCPDACCTGTCVGPPPPRKPRMVMEPCASTGDCDEGLYCHEVANVCRALVPAGAPCTTAEACDYGLGCAGTPRTCRPLPGPGEPCPELQCRDEGTSCHSTTRICTQVALAGATCASSQECSPYYPCDAMARRCRRGPGPGDPCTSACAFAQTYCDPASGTCVDRKDDGAPCTRGDECANDSCIDQACALPPACE